MANVHACVGEIIRFAGLTERNSLTCGNIPARFRPPPTSLVDAGINGRAMSGEASGELDCRRLSCVDRSLLIEARLQAHHALQWLARVARAYVAPQPDDGHTSLRWENGLDCFTTQQLRDETQLSLQLATLVLRERKGAAHIASLSLAGRTGAQARQWLGEHLGKRGLDARALDAPAPYEIPAHAVDRGASYEPAKSADALLELAAWYANAQVSLDRVKEQMIGSKFSVSPVCCWPHHFDLATLTTFPMQNADTIGSVGAGFSPGDEYYDEPYFYVSVYPEPDPAMLPTLPAMGHWHTHKFSAAIKPAHKILADKDRATGTDEFLQGTVALALRILSVASK
jgi:hypothetical protein